MVSHACDSHPRNLTPRRSFVHMASVLLFEDEPLLQETLSDLLKNAGFTPVVGALDRGAATKQIKAANYDLVLTDLHMPNFNGVDVLAWVRRNRFGTPVVALTGASPNDLKRMGCDPTLYSAFLFKPADLELVLSVVGRLISDQDLSAQATRH
jgi:CheY-like chemotaxis protein